MRVAFGYLARTFPHMSLAAAEEAMQYRTKVLIYGVHELPIQLR